jgi:hypothetical protein
MSIYSNNESIIQDKERINLSFKTSLHYFLQENDCEMGASALDGFGNFFDDTDLYSSINIPEFDNEDDLEENITSLVKELYYRFGNENISRLFNLTSRELISKLHKFMYDFWNYVNNSNYRFDFSILEDDGIIMQVSYKSNNKISSIIKDKHTISKLIKGVTECIINNSNNYSDKYYTVVIGNDMLKNKIYSISICLEDMKDILTKYISIANEQLFKDEGEK